MTVPITLVLVLAIVVFGIIWLIKNILSGKKTVQVDLAQGVFASLFMQDAEMMKFDGKDSEESFQFGQDRLWEETKRFRIAYDKMITEGMKVGDYTILSSALKIVKIAYIMDHVEEFGPIVVPKEMTVKDEPTESDSNSD